MIASLKGIVDGRTGSSVVVDVAGVGYLVHASARTLDRLGPMGSEARVIVVTQVREDAITLFGFADREERDVFLLLTSVQGVGPRVGLSILSALAPGEVVGAIVAEDRAAITRADGVGPKLAGRIVSELKDKAATVAPALGVQGAVAVKGDGAEEDAKAALSSLGFAKAEIAQLVAEARAVPNPPQGAAALISVCLKLAGRRQ